MREEFTLKVEPKYTVIANLKRYFLVFTCLIAISFVFVSYYSQLNKAVSDTATNYVQDIIEQNANAVDNKIEGNFQTLEALSVFIGSMPYFDLTKIRSLLENTNENNNFVRLEVALTDGKSYVASSSLPEFQKSNTIQVWEKEYYKRVLRGETKVIQYESQKESKGYYIYSMPIYKEGQIAGVLSAVKKEEDLLGSVKKSMGNSSCFLVNHNDNCLASVQKEMKKVSKGGAIPAFQGGENATKLQIERLNDKMKAGSCGMIECANETGGMYILYYPLNSIPNYFISIIPNSTMDSLFKKIQLNVNQLTGYLFFLFVLMVIFLIYARRQIIIKLEQKNQQLAINNERYGFITEQSGSIIFEYDFTTGKVFYTTNFKQKFGYDPITDNFVMKITNSDNIHPEDKETIMDLFESLKKGKKYGETEARIKTKDSTTLWMRIKAAGIFDQDKTLLRIVGKMIDITEEKQELESLKAKVNKDSVTGVYNKQTTHNLIDAYLNGEGRGGRHALLVIDIDDFKGINDALGHRQGDAIILTLAEKMKAMFRSEDIIGRIGGDEFMVLIKNVVDMELVAEKAKNICNIFQEEINERYTDITVSNSVGIAIYGKDGMTYEDLYEAADRALYRCKDEGKGTFVFHNSPFYLT